MKKFTFTAISDISINVMLKDGGYKHINFSPTSYGGSVFHTEDEELAEAMTKHHRFGKLFNMAVEEETEVQEPEDEQAISVDTITDIEVPGQADAKEYLADNFGVSRSKLRSTAAIIAAAKQFNINFIFTDK